MSKRIYVVTAPDHLGRDGADRIRGEAKRAIKNATGEEDPAVIILGGGATMSVIDIEDK